MPSIIVHLLLVLGTLILGLTLKSSAPIRSLFFVAALSLYIPLFFIPYPGADEAIRYSASFWGIYFLSVAFDLLVIRPNAQDALKPNNQEKPASQLPLLSRLKWATTLMFNFRGANWNCAVPGLRCRRNLSQWQFVSSRLVHAGFYYLLGDILSIYARRSPAFQYPPQETFGARGLLLQGVNVVIFWTLLVAFINRLHTLLSAVFVALRISDQEDWPAFFGIWSQTKSVRTFWGKSWHQNLRRSIQPQAKYFAQSILRLPPKSLQSTYVQLFICFLLSGVFHAVADWLAMRNPSSALDNVSYFVLQAAFVTLEDIIIYIGKKIGVTWIPSMLSYAWVAGWMTVSGPLWMERTISGKYLAFIPELSLVEKVLDKFGFA
ncbi:membrane bound O-acyl transferase family-domain-containing protein [Cyathus striatus]|nr:membrane bound O-acyl transferase family-domain-containing protein [Cyathus striatus]